MGGSSSTTMTQALTDYRLQNGKQSLSSREIEMLQAMADGLTNEEIGQNYWLSPHTIKGHAKNIYQKMGTRGRTDSVAEGFRLGIIV